MTQAKALINVCGLGYAEYLIWSLLTVCMQQIPLSMMTVPHKN